MGDAPARTELKVTTGPIRGSRKIYVGDRKVAMRAIDLEPSSLASRPSSSTTPAVPTLTRAAHRHHDRPSRAPP